jgi:hypothetical protein
MKIKILGLAFSIFLFGAIPSQALLVNNGNYTTDTSANLNWLDLTITQNLGYTYVVNNLLCVGCTYEGYRYATMAEVNTLLTSAGIVHPYVGVVKAAEVSNYNTLIDLLGATAIFSPSDRYARGIVDFVPPGFPGFHESAIIVLEPSNNLMQAASQSGFVNDNPGQFDNFFIGSFLVSEVSAVPLPAAFPLFASGVGALGLLGWRRKRKAAALAA